MVGSEKMNKCPTCGQLVPDNTLPKGLKLCGNELLIFKTVKRAGANGISTAELLNVLYSGVRDGGPLTARVSMRVTIHNLNSKLFNHNLVIRASRGGHGVSGEYVLRQI